MAWARIGEIFGRGYGARSAATGLFRGGLAYARARGAVPGLGAYMGGELGVLGRWAIGGLPAGGGYNYLYGAARIGGIGAGLYGANYTRRNFGLDHPYFSAGAIGVGVGVGVAGGRRGWFRGLRNATTARATTTDAARAAAVTASGNTGAPII